ncbi:Required for respiratory growth protein 9 [Penicillium cosmopolitanum]|uniref:Required for respiratory growth protein 9, mitochondrial n=1 Tax=Penicillium cosmopolitanum TaxID=1131564 RepID=A0A9W9W7E4_9EURO|nr:Required for respiratory growth protein 9 [Penicillium cosmopolitanum]KAJ5407756.1 Required for respiratory growth protein 9 [Penicillium cosmopolitanum]
MDTSYLLCFLPVYFSYIFPRFTLSRGPRIQWQSTAYRRQSWPCQPFCAVYFAPRQPATCLLLFAAGHVLYDRSSIPSTLDHLLPIPAFSNLKATILSPRTPESHPSPSSESTPQLATTSDSTAPRQKNRSQGAKSRPANKSRNTKDQTETKKHRDRKDRKDRKESDKEKDKKRDKADKLPKKPKKPEIWEIQKDALGKKFPDGWNPAKRLSPDALDGIRHLNTTAPDRFTTAVLAEEFKVSPEAIRRILKSKWRPSEGEMDKRRVRWENRHERIWSQMAELGLRPPTQRSQPLSDTRGLFNDKKK